MSITAVGLPGPRTGRNRAAEIASDVRAVAAGEAEAASVVDALDARAAALVTAGSASERDRADAALLFAAHSLVDAVVEETSVRMGDVGPLVEAAAEVTGLSREAAAAALYMRASASPHLVVLAPRVAAQAHLRLLVALAPINDASVWTADLGEVACIASTGEGAETRRSRRVAAATVTGGDATLDEDTRAQITGVPIVLWGQKVGAVVIRARPEDRSRASVFVLECRAMLAAVVERDVLLDRSTSREQQIHMASERRLRRVGYDLHDGPLQDVAALAIDMRSAREQLSQNLTGRLRSILLGRFDDLGGRLEEIDRTLRELSHSLESSRAGADSLPDALQRELAGFDRRSGIDAELSIAGTFDSLSASQRIALYRIVQEALSNAREHSQATRVVVKLEKRIDGTRLSVSDDGVGFDVPSTVVGASRRGRLGLVGMSERVRLLGGAFSLTSSPNGGTDVVVSLPNWSPAMRVGSDLVAV